jgi:hypothetical protein
MGALGSKHKHHTERTEDATVRNKARFIKALCKGMQPALAAQRCHLGYSTVYEWKADDPEFAKAWTEAVELGLDALEYDTYSSGLSSDRQFILKGRRKEIYGPQQDDQRVTNGNFLLQIAEQEHQRRLVRLGLAAPDVIEGDYEEIDAAVPPAAGGDTSSES